VISLAFFRRDNVPSFVIDAFGMHVPFYLVAASLLLTVIGALAGYFVVPMNALLQYRGHVLMSAGHSIAVQNFNENLSVLAMLCLYAVLVRYDLSVPTIIMLFGVFVITTMLLIMRRHRMNMRRSENDPLTLIREVRH
jgi:LPLT family lysophospholipid transporter-like MFS transporter